VAATYMCAAPWYGVVVDTPLCLFMPSVDLPPGVLLPRRWITFLWRCDVRGMSVLPGAVIGYSLFSLDPISAIVLGV
jgi:hypothetical protein